MYVYHILRGNYIEHIAQSKIENKILAHWARVFFMSPLTTQNRFNSDLIHSIFGTLLYSILSTLTSYKIFFYFTKKQHKINNLQCKEYKIKYRINTNSKVFNKTKSLLQNKNILPANKLLICLCLPVI